MNDTDKQDLNDSYQQKKDDSSRKMERSAARNITIFFAAILGLGIYNVSSSIDNFMGPETPSVANKLLTEEEFKNLIDPSNESALPLIPKKDQKKPADTKTESGSDLDILINSYTTSPYTLVDAQAYSGVNKEVSNYVWNLLKIDEKLTKDVVNKVVVYQNETSNQAKLDEMRASVEELIESGKNEMVELKIPEGINDETKTHLEKARSLVVMRQETFQKGLESIKVEDAKDHTFIHSLAQEILFSSQDSSTLFGEALTQSKNY